MLSASSSVYHHSLQNALLIALSSAFLPLDTLLLGISYFLSYVFRNKCENHRKTARSKPGFKPRNVLVTGMGMTKGLVLARSFYEAGHNVIGVDFETHGSLVCGPMSRSLKRFHPLSLLDVKNGSGSYLQSLLNIILSEKVDLWVSCSGVATAV